MESDFIVNNESSLNLVDAFIDNIDIWPTFEQDTQNQSTNHLYFPEQQSINEDYDSENSSLSADDHHWTPIPSNCQIKSNIENQPPAEAKIKSTDNQTKECIESISKKVRRILVPSIKNESELNRFTGVFVDNSLHTLVADKINEAVQNSSSFDKINFDDILKQVTNDEDIKGELDSMCPMVAKIIFTSKQFRRLQMKLHQPTVKDHIERPHVARMQKLLLASKRYHKQQLTGILKTPTESSKLLLQSKLKKYYSKRNHHGSECSEFNVVPFKCQSRNCKTLKSQSDFPFIQPQNRIRDWSSIGLGQMDLEPPELK